MTSIRAGLTVLAPPVLSVLALASPSMAQCGYESGSPQCFSFAPPPSEVGNISENLILRSNELTITGDIRFRARSGDSPNDAPYNGRADQIASRARVNMNYVLNEKARAFVQFNFSETFAGSESYSDAYSGQTFNGISQAYLLSEDLLGLGEELRIGRSYFTLASGLVYGSCDFLQYPAAGTGAWFSKHFGEDDQHALEVFAFDNNGTQTSAATGSRFVGATGRIGLGNDVLEAIEPWVLLGTGDGDVVNEDQWFGLTVHGAVGKQEDHPSLFDWNVEFAQREVDATDDSRTAYRAVVSKDLAEVTDGVVKKVTLTRTDAEGAMHINPGDFNTAGLLHQYGGAWRSELITNQLGVKLKPTEKLDIDLAYINFDAAGNKNNELDVMLGTPIGNGVHGWVGYGRDEDDREVLYAQLTMFF
ncbi:MAG: hypothetical protein R3F49_09930 [Planctomycetota bacterium]